MLTFWFGLAEVVAGTVMTLAFGHRDESLRGSAIEEEEMLQDTVNVVVVGSEVGKDMGHRRWVVPHLRNR